MNWTITPFQSVGPVSFGQSRSSVRSTLGEGFTSFQKAKGENQADAYDGLGVHLYYDDHDGLEFVVLFPPTVVKLNSCRLIGRNIKKMRHNMQALGLDAWQMRSATTTMESVLGSRSTAAGWRVLLYLEGGITIINSNPEGSAKLISKAAYVHHAPESEQREPFRTCKTSIRAGKPEKELSHSPQERTISAVNGTCCQATAEAVRCY